MTEFETGKLLTIPEDQYHADRTAVSKSWLDYIHKSPAHLQAYLRGDIEVTQAEEFGILVHAFVLEPDTVSERFYREPDVNRRTKDGKARLAELAEQHKGKRGIRDTVYDEALKVRDSVYGNNAAKRVLSGGDNELSVFWKNGETSALCKARADKVRTNFLVDVKTTQDASPFAFAKSIANFRYTVQAHHYMEGFDAPRFVWIAVEKKPPYAVAVYADNDDIRAHGQRHRDADLRLYAECKAANNWPGYPEKIQPIYLPPWAK